MAVASRRKWWILKLLADKGEVVEIMEHVYSFYHKFMGLEGGD
jgi:hypothetical protein